MKALRIDASGVPAPVEITGETIEEQNDCIHSLLGGYFECIRLYGKDAVMLVDEDGRLKQLPKNKPATILTSRTKIVGTVLIVGLMPTNDGDVFTDCPARFFRFANNYNLIYGKGGS